MNPLVNDEINEIAAEMNAGRKALALVSDRDRPADVLPPTGTHYGDIENAERFLKFADGDLLYCAEAKKWMLWNGQQWHFDDKDHVFHLAKDFARNLYFTEPPTKEALKNCDRVNNRTGFNAMLDLAARQQTVSITEFDRDPYLLNCRNGTLDLRYGTFRKHARTDRLTRCLKYDYDATAVSPVFDQFLETIQPDPSVRSFLQRSIGYSFLGLIRERSFWILYGTGNNGKSAFVNLFNTLLDDYASSTTSASIMAVRQSGTIPNDIARLKGKRFVIIPETEENERINAALIKALSAGDTVTARFLFGEFFDFEFTAKLWIATNHKPIITDHSKGFWDRLKLIPFAVDIPADRVIKSDILLRQLLNDAPAIIAWAVRGCRDYWQLNSLNVPDAIAAEIEQYRHEQDSIAQFLEERCETLAQARERGTYIVEAHYRTANSDLYKAYRKFCEENGEYQRSHRRVTQNLIERGFKQLNRRGRYWDGIKLLDMTTDGDLWL